MIKPIIFHLKSGERTIIVNPMHIAAAWTEPGRAASVMMASGLVYEVAEPFDLVRDSLVKALNAMEAD